MVTPKLCLETEIEEEIEQMGSLDFKLVLIILSWSMTMLIYQMSQATSIELMLGTIEPCNTQTPLSSMRKQQRSHRVGIMLQLKGNEEKLTLYLFKAKIQNYNF